MINSYTTIIDGNNKGLPGMKIKYVREVFHNNTEITKITVTGLRGEIIIKNSRSKKINNQLNSDEINIIDIVKEIAANAVRIDIGTLESKSRVAEAVFGRNCVMWYAMRYKNFSTSGAGAIFKKDHSTAIYAKKDFEKSEEYQSFERKKWKQRFLDKLYERSKTNIDVFKL